MAKKPQVHRRPYKNRRRKNRTRFSSTPAVYIEAQTSLISKSKLEDARVWTNRQVSQRKVVWVSPCCGAAQTGRAPQFNPGHSIPPVMLASKEQVEFLGCTSAFKKLLLLKTAIKSNKYDESFYIPFCSADHKLVGEDVIHEDDDNHMMHEDQGLPMTESPGEIDGDYCNNKAEEIRLLREKIMEQESLISRLRQHLKTAKQGTFSFSVATQTPKPSRKKLPSLQVTTFSSKFQPSLSTISCLRAQANLGKRHLCSTCEPATLLGQRSSQSN